MILIKNRLSAGFFSNLNAVIGWYWYSMRTDTPVYIHWDGLNNQNIFDEFFNQKYTYQSHFFESDGFYQFSPFYIDLIKDAFKEDVSEDFYNKYENGWYLCKGKVYVDDDFQKLRNLYNYIYTTNLKIKPNKITTSSIPENTLGVNYRFIDMYFFNEAPDFSQPLKNHMSLDQYHSLYLEQIEKTFEEGKYNNVYLASSQRIFFELCLNKFKDKLLYLPMQRLDEGLWQQNRNVTLEKEYADVLTDVFNLSNCSHLLISPSNIAFALLYMNPNITYNTFDFLKNLHTQ